MRRTKIKKIKLILTDCDGVYSSKDLIGVFNNVMLSFFTDSFV